MIDLLSTGRGKHAPDGALVVSHVIPSYDWPPPPPAMRQMDGRDQEIQDWLLATSELAEIQISWLVDKLAATEGGQVAAFICNEGMHRSVAGAEIAAQRLRDLGLEVSVSHLNLEGEA